jgi:prevent-host-death family protein
MTEPTVRRKPHRSRVQSTGQHVAAATFKAKCLELMDRVNETGTEYVTKHGRPVAKLVPYTQGKARSSFGSMKGTVLKYDRPFDPIDGDYDIDRA